MRFPLIRRGNDETPIAWWEWLFWPFLATIAIPAMLLSIVIFTPYYWLYPDRHAHEYDGGTAHEQALMDRYRAITSHVSFWRRCGRVLIYPWRRPRNRRVTTERVRP